MDINVACGNCGRHEIVQSDGTPKVKTFRIPSVAQGSIYHEPVNVNPLTLTESALSRYNRTDDVWRGGPYPHYESINGQNRQAVLTQLVQTYNTDIALLSHHSHHALCTAASRICSAGLPSLNVSPSELQSWPVTNGPRPNRSGMSQRQQPRMAVSPALLVEMLWGVNFAMYNGCSKVAKQAVQDVHARASYELLADVQLVTEAILNSERLGVGLTEDSGPMGIPISTSPHTNVKRATITNASFKAKKLPDDISVVPEKPEQDLSSVRLSPIEEENKGVLRHALRTSKGRKDKDKEKVRSKDSRKDSDTSSAKSLVINGDTVDGVQVTVVDSQKKTQVDTIELTDILRKTYVGHRVGEDHTNGNNSAAHKSGCGEGQGSAEVKSRPTSLNGAQINPESYSTDL
ncbi:hypothetical protein BaRGS_00001980 [Batillaria attramentaria]|uniref:Uncharacterized protein n=1 Tax=Batillaria attramentaria TaxID=370345 RepID=A0ABD0M4T7_9CAEN